MSDTTARCTYEWNPGTWPYTQRCDKQLLQGFTRCVEHKIPLQFISDPGHGWLEVPFALFPDARDFGTGFGYIDESKGVIYLEEDCEASLFMEAHGADVTLVEIDGARPGSPHNVCSHKHRYCDHSPE